jgi:hypothetical protein
MASISGSGTDEKRAVGKSGTRSRTRSSAANAATLRLQAQVLKHTLSTDEVADRIATAAYFRAEQRGFQPGHELDDWLIAEREVHQRLSS